MKLNKFMYETTANVNTLTLPVVMVLLDLSKKFPRMNYFKLGKLYDFEPYENGREHGLTIRSVADPSKSVSFSENRSSDDIVVYENFCGEYMGGVEGPKLSDEAYRLAKYFPPESSATVAKYIYKIMKSWK